MIVKDPLAHVSHKQHTEVKSKWHEQEISLDFKLGQIKFHMLWLLLNSVQLNTYLSLVYYVPGIVLGKCKDKQKRHKM